MKRWIVLLLVLVFIFALVGCKSEGNKTEENKTDASEADVVEAVVPTEETTPNESEPVEEGSLPWPKEFYDWGVPIIEDAVVTLTEDRSSNGGTITQGVNVLAVIGALSEDDYKAYLEEVVEEGFEKDPSSLEGVMLFYNKMLPEGPLKLTISYSPESTTIIANNEAAAAAKDANAGGSVDWPEAVKDIPSFDKGKFKETVAMGGNMFILTYLDVEEADLEWYRGVLVKAGFEEQIDVEGDGYAKFTSTHAYSVGFVLEGGSLQLVVTVGTL